MPRTSLPGGRPKVDLEYNKAELSALYAKGLTIDQIVQYLQEECDITVTNRTLKRRFQEWQVRRRQATVVSEDLKQRIQSLFFEVGLDDKDMLRVLQDEGFQVGKSALVRLRFELNLCRSLRTEDQQQQAEEFVRELVTEAIANGDIDGYRYKDLYTHFRQRGHVIARDRLFKIYRTINPDAVRRRSRDLQRQRGA